MRPTITTHVIFTSTDGLEIPISFIQANMGMPVPSDEELDACTAVYAPMGSHPSFGGQMVQMIGMPAGEPGIHRGDRDLPDEEITIASWTRA